MRARNFISIVVAVWLFFFLSVFLLATFEWWNSICAMIRIKWAWFYGIFCYLAVCIWNQIEEKLSHCARIPATIVWVQRALYVFVMKLHTAQIIIIKCQSASLTACVIFCCCFFVCTTKTNRESEKTKEKTPSCAYFAYCFHIFVDNDHCND